MNRRPTNWISREKASQMLGVTRGTFIRNFADRITQQRLPGMKPRYSRAEVERMAAEAIVPPARSESDG